MYMNQNREFGYGSNYEVKNKGNICSPNKISDLAPLEHLFSTKFAGLTIDDEYRYNLKYLVSQSNGITQEHKPSNIEKTSSYGSLPAKTANHSIKSNSSPRGPFHGGSQVKSVGIESHTSRSSRSRTHSSSKSESSRHSMSPVRYIQISSDIDDTGDYDGYHKRTAGKIRNHVMKLQRLPSPRRAVITKHTPPTSPYPGLHIYVTESPPRSYYDVLSSTETSKVIRHSKRSAACDPMISLQIGNQSKFFKSAAPSARSDVTDARNQHTNIPENLTPTNIPQRPRRFTPHNSSEDTRSLSSTYSRPFNDNDNRIGSPEYPPDCCFNCGKRIYPVDRISTGDRQYHKACFRCSTCQRTLLPGNYASLEGIIFCKPHYIEQFRLNDQSIHSAITNTTSQYRETACVPLDTTSYTGYYFFNSSNVIKPGRYELKQVTAKSSSYDSRSSQDS